MARRGTVITKVLDDLADTIAKRLRPILSAEVVLGIISTLLVPDLVARLVDNVPEVLQRLG
jgi:hypothetical protein